MDNEGQGRDDDADTVQEAEDGFLNALAGHLESPSEATWETLSAAAGAMMPVGGGFSPWARDVGNEVGPLLDRHKPTWTRLLQSLAMRGLSSVEGPGKRLKAASPFVGKLLVFVDEHPAQPVYYGETAPLIANAIEGHERHEAFGKMTMVALDYPGSAEVETPFAPEDKDTGC